MYRKAAERLHEDADLHSEIADFVLTELPGFRWATPASRASLLCVSCGSC